MFGNILTYYHGTTQNRWRTIQKDGFFRPDRAKSVGSYWITRGAYFVCENPYIALWYAHFLHYRDEKKRRNRPTVISIRFEAKEKGNGRILNLLTADGHTVLAIAHKRFRDKMYANLNVNENNELPSDTSYNLDSKVLQLLMANSPHLKGIIASFQEGQSFQKLINDKEYFNQHVLSQKGICPGDHVEICFYPKLELNESLTLTPISATDIIDAHPNSSFMWNLVCHSLTSVLQNTVLRDGFWAYLKKQYPEVVFGEIS